MFEAGFIESALDILSYPESTIRPTMVGFGDKIFKMNVLIWLENDTLTLTFANTVNTIQPR